MEIRVHSGADTGCRLVLVLPDLFVTEPNHLDIVPLWIEDVCSIVRLNTDFLSDPRFSIIRAASCTVEG